MDYKIPQSVLVVIHDTQGRILLLERADEPGWWQSVTGSKNSLDELLWQTALRELYEETGIEAVYPMPSERVNRVKKTDSGQRDCATWVNYLLDWQKHIEFEIFPQWRPRYAAGVTHNTEHWFSVCIDASTTIVLSPREHLQYQWFSIEAAAQRCFSWSNAQAVLELSSRMAQILLICAQSRR